jgi:hypothetical protein
MPDVVCVPSRFIRFLFATRVLGQDNTCCIHTARFAGSPPTIVLATTDVLGSVGAPSHLVHAAVP